MPKRIAALPGQESVWDYPRPPRVEATTRRLEIVFAGERLADTRRAFRVLETSHPPVYYIPESDIRMELLRRIDRGSWCEWKGQAHYFDVVHGARQAPAAAWGYDRPTPAFAAIGAHVAFYAGPMDACLVNGEAVTPQPGGFYGGWITRDLAGPFKGEPGSFGW
jgi:uncharacterized protein (DUF427 family)